MALVRTGTPVVCYAQLTNALPGPTTFSLFVQMGQASVAMPTGASGQLLRLYIVNLTLSSNDATAAKVTVDTGGTTPTKLLSAYMSATQVLQPEEVAMGILRCIPGVLPRVTATAVSVSATVECVLFGYLGAT